MSTKPMPWWLGTGGVAPLERLELTSTVRRGGRVWEKSKGSGLFESRFPPLTPQQRLLTPLISSFDFLTPLISHEQTAREGGPIGSRASDYIPWYSLIHLVALGTVIDPTARIKSYRWVREPDSLNQIDQGNIRNDENGLPFVDPNGVGDISALLGMLPP